MNGTFKRDKAGLKMFTCSDCGSERDDSFMFERRGEIFCRGCVCRTAERRAYERWFVEPNS